MKKIIVFVLTACMFCSIMASTVHAYTCYASSASGSWGMGWSDRRGRAKRIALRECAARTPYWDSCWIDYCEY